MEIAVLTARLEADVAGFMAGIKAADTMANKMQEDLRDLEKSAFAATREMKNVGMDPAQSERVRMQAKIMEDAVHGVYRAALEADKELDDFGFQTSDVTRFVAEAAIVKRELNDMARDAARLRREMELTAVSAIPAQIMRRSAIGGMQGENTFLPARSFEAGQGVGYSGIVRPDPIERARLDAEYARAQQTVADEAARETEKALRRSVSAYTSRLSEGYRLPGGAIPLGGGDYADATIARRAAQEYKKYANEVRNLAKYRELDLGPDLGMLRSHGGGAVPLGTGAPETPEQWVPAGLRNMTAGQRGAIDFFRRQGYTNEQIAGLLKEQSGGDRGGGAGGILSGGFGRRRGRPFNEDTSLLHDLVSGGGRYGGRGGRYNVPGPNVLAGILPGGSRARPAALAALGLGLGALGPAAVPAAAGLGVGAAAAMTGLVGSAATLKLAFADLTAASFTSKAAFDLLTPVQKNFVLTLKSLDVGVMKPLERIAQNNLLPRLESAARTALSPQMIGALQGSVGAFATNIGQGVQGAAKIFGSAEFAQKFQQVMVANAKYVRAFIVDIGRLADSFFTVLKAAIPFTNWLSGLGTTFTKWLDTTTKTAAANGKLADFFDKAKVSLQAFGGVISSLLHVFGAFGSAVGFGNAIGTLKLLQTLLQGLANLLKANGNVLHDMFAGALQSARDILRVLHPLITSLNQLLQLVNKLAHAIGGWRVIIDAAFALWAAKTLLAISNTKLFSSALASTGAAAKKGAVGVEAAMAADSASIVRTTGVLARFKAGLLGIAGTAVPIAIALSLIPPKGAGQKDLERVGLGWMGHLPGIGGLDTQVANFANKYLRPLLGKTPFANEPAPQTGVTVPKGHLPGTYGMAPSTRTNPGGFLLPGQLLAKGYAPGTYGMAPSSPDNPGGYLTIAQATKQVPAFAKNQQAKQFVASLSLPARIQNEVNTAPWGSTKAQAKAYNDARSYYLNLLATPGLTRAQKQLIRNAGSGYAAPNPFQQTGGGSIGFGASTDAGGAVFNAQQAVQQAMGTGSGVSFSKQVELAKAYERSAAAAYEHLKNQKVVAADRAAKEAQLTKLLRDEGQARKYIAAITDHQAKALAKMVDDSRKAQIAQHSTTISAIRANLVSRVSAAATPQAALDAVNKALLAASGQYAQLWLMNKKLLSQTNQTSKLKAEENQLRKEMNQTLGIIHTAEKDRAKALKAQAAAQLERKWERLFGITKGDTASVESVLRRERASLLRMVHQISHTSSHHLRGAVTAAADKYAAIPGAPKMSIDQLIKSLQAHGAHFSKRALEDFAMIRKYLEEVKKSGAKVSSVISDKITALLTQIEHNTNPRNNVLPTYHLASLKTVMGNLTAIKDPGKRKAAAEKLLEMEIYGGMLPKVHSIAGIPIFNSGVNRASGLGLPGFVHGSGHIRRRDIDPGMEPHGRIAQAFHHLPKHRDIDPGMGAGSRHLQGVIPGFNKIAEDVGAVAHAVGTAAHAVRVAGHWIVANKMQKQDNEMAKLNARLVARGHLPGSLATSITEQLFYRPYNKPEGATIVKYGDTTIIINGYEKDPKLLAAEVRNALLKTRRRNSPQTRGVNGGRSVGLS